MRFQGIAGACARAAIVSFAEASPISWIAWTVARLIRPDASRGHRDDVSCGGGNVLEPDQVLARQGNLFRRRSHESHPGGNSPGASAEASHRYAGAAAVPESLTEPIG